MERGVSLFLIILILSSNIVYAFSLKEFSSMLEITSNSVKENEKPLIELCKFKSTGPEIVMQKTGSSQVLIWLYEPGKERFGELKLITDFEKVNENKYNFRVEENGPIYTVKAVIPDFCIRFKEETEKASGITENNLKQVCATNPILTITSVNVGGRELSSGAYETCIYQNYDNEFLSSSATAFPNYGATVNGRCPSSLCHEIEEIQIENPTVSETSDECSDLMDEQSCESSSLNCEWVIQETINPPAIPAECSKNGVENVFLRISRVISAIFGNVILLFVKIMLFIPNLFGLNADMPFLPLVVDCSQYNMKIQATKEATMRGNCETRSSEEIELGYIKISGGATNRAWLGIPLKRMKGYAKINAWILLDKTKKNCGNFEFVSNAKLWVHRDLYKLYYDLITKSEEGALFPNKKEFFPGKEFGSFVIFIDVDSSNGKITFSTKFKKAEDSPPDDLSKFDMGNNDGGKSETKELKKEGEEKNTPLYQLKNMAIPIILNLYRKFLGVGATVGQLGTPVYEDTMLKISQDRIDNLLESLKEDSSDPKVYDKEFKTNIQPLINQAIDRLEYRKKIKEKCEN